MSARGEEKQKRRLAYTERKMLGRLALGKKIGHGPMSRRLRAQVRR